ncbi:MAG: type II secretion system protein [Candidatus Brocadiales bacterium]|nr:type II secretion system protein [Candidatus Brocadiales bacterium]
MKNRAKKELRKIVNGRVDGFSMFELIMVVGIAGIMMAIALPRLASVSQIDLYSTARQAKSDIRYTQELAMSKYRKTTITFGSNLDTYSITSSGQTLNKQLPPSSNAIFDAGSTLVFTFNAAGEPVTGGGGTLTISSGASNEQIMVSNITGNVDIL